MPNLSRRSLFRLGGASLVVPRAASGLLGSNVQSAETLAEPSTLATYEEGVDGTPVPVAGAVVAVMGAPVYSAVDASHGALGWLSSAASGGGCLVYTNPAPAASSGSVYLRPHAFAPASTATVLTLMYDVVAGSSSAAVRLTADGRVEILDAGNTRVAITRKLWLRDDSLRLDWEQTWDGSNIAITAWIYVQAHVEGWKSDGVVQATFPSAMASHIALGQQCNPSASVGFDTYRGYTSITTVQPYAPPFVGGRLHTYDEGVDGAAVVAGADMVTGTSGAPRYAAAAALHGPLGVVLPLSGAGTVRYDNPYPPAHTGSLYVRTITRGTSDSHIVTIQNGLSILAYVKLSKRGTIRIVSPQGLGLAETSARGKLKSWARIDWQATWDGSGFDVHVRYFSEDAESPDNYTEISATLLASATPDTIAIGSTSTGWKLYFDTTRMYGDTATWPSPYNPVEFSRAPGMAAWAGDATQSSVEISAYTNGTTSVGLVVSSNADLSNSTSWPAAPPNAAGWNKWSVTDLTAAGQYFYQFTDTPVDGQPQFIGELSTFKTLQPVGVACTTRIAVGSCAQTNPTNTAAFGDIAAWAPDRSVHVGDFGYPNDLSRDPIKHMNNWSLNCTDAGIRKIQAIGCMDYVISDHDDNGTGSSNLPTFNDPLTMANISAWQEVVPARMEDRQSPPHGRWRAEVEGNVRFVKLDTRSIDKTDTTTTATDPRATESTMLGAAQLAWLQSQIDTAVQERQLLVIFTDPAWNGTSPGPPIPVTYCDKWPSYIYERDLISDYAASRGAQLFIVFGDSHGLQQDDGTNEKNGFASICCGPLDQELHMHYQDSYQWNYPDGILDQGGPYRVAQQYQRLTISQDVGSSTVTVTAEARDCSPAVEGTRLRCAR